MKRITFILLSLLIISPVFAQITQTLRGVVLDNASKAPIPYATVQILNTNPAIAISTDSLGAFTLANVKVGRYDIQITNMGYDPTIVREVAIISAKQTVLSIYLNENIKTLGEVTVRPYVNKEQPLNAMATVSARMLSVEEAKRFAGGFDDPARLASAFAGVTANSGVNGIMVRGNAPKYLQWKMEGVEISNPNHFGDLKSFGGGILTGLSSQMLANSDFFTGAFPAEYNNALSGVFDIALKKGNNQKRESTFQVGIIGVDASQEGPFRKGGKSTYAVNYRISTLALLAPLLPENANSIRYQDLSFKLNFPTKKAGIFSIWGLGLADGAKAKAKTDSLSWAYKDDKQQSEIRQYNGVIGLSHTLFTNTNTFIKTTLAATGNNTNWNTQQLSNQLELKPYSAINYTNWNYVFSSFINSKFSANHTNRTGFSVTQLMYNIALNKSLQTGELPTDIVNSNGSSTLISGHSSSSINLNSSLQMNLGLNMQYFTLNNHYTIEPRIGFRQQVGAKQTFGVAYGLHSRLENVNFYFNNSLTTGESSVNKNLDFTKAHHFVLSYDLKITDLVHLKVEPYYQYLFSVPVVANSSFSFINLQNDWFFAEKLQNTGEGKNLGIDLTLEKYISNGYYYLLSASLFDSQYKGGDGVWRSSRFNRNYVCNFLIGKEWQLGKSKQNTLSVNARATFQGGNHYSPVNEAASVASKDVVYDESKAYSQKSASTVNMHLTVSYKTNKAKSSREIALKILNMTGQSDFYGYKFNYQKNATEQDLASVIIPNLSYKIEF